MGGLFNGPDVWAKLANNAETRGFLAQPDFVQMMNAIQANPDSVGQYIQDPRMMKVMGVLLGVNTCSSVTLNISLLFLVLLGTQQSPSHITTAGHYSRRQLFGIRKLSSFGFCSWLCPQHWRT